MVHASNHESFCYSLYDSIMTPLPYLSLLKVSGADAGRFLQAQVTANLAGLRVPSATFSAYCSPRGQVVATLLLAPREDHWLLVVAANLLEILQARLQKFILRDDVLLHPQNGHYLVTVDSHDAPIDSMILLKPTAPSIQYAISSVKPIANPEATARWQRTELLFGIPWLNPASTEKYIPQMLGLDALGAVSFSKGCYPGQEVIARARHLGQVKRRPQVLDLEGPQTPDLTSPCLIQTANGQTASTLVHCVSTASQTYTVFAVAALDPDEAVTGLEQNGQYWSATRV